VLKNWLYEPSFDQADLLQALAAVSREDVMQYATTFKNELAVQMYVHGQLRHRSWPPLLTLSIRPKPLRSLCHNCCRFRPASTRKT